MKKVFVCILVVFIMMAQLTGCGEKSKLLGTWVYTDRENWNYYFVFDSNNAWRNVIYAPNGDVQDFYTGTYSVSGDELKTQRGSSSPQTFLYRFDEEKLVIGNMVFMRVSSSQIPPSTP